MSAQCEKAISRLGKQCYQGYARGLIKEKIALGMCHEMSETFAEAKTLRAELEEEIERDALDGLSLEEAKKADEHRNVTQMGKAKREAKLRLTRFAGRQTVNWHLQNHRDKVKKLSHELGLRALLLHESEPLLEVKGHQTLCELANRLDEDANKKWDEIVAGGDVKGAKGISALSFHTILVQFIANFANFSKGTMLGDQLLKWFKYDSAEEEQKLAQHYQGTEAAAALAAQLNEVEEPDLDIGRELATMEQAYTATPEEWEMAPVEEEAWVADTGESDTWGEAEETTTVDDDATWGSQESKSDWSDEKPAETWSATPAADSVAAVSAGSNVSGSSGDWDDNITAAAAAPRIGQAPPDEAASDDDDWPDMGQAPAPAVAAPPAPATAPAAPPAAAQAPIEISIPDPDPGLPVSRKPPVPTSAAPIEISIPDPGAPPARSADPAPIDLSIPDLNPALPVTAKAPVPSSPDDPAPLNLEIAPPDKPFVPQLPDEDI